MNATHVIGWKSVFVFLTVWTLIGCASTGRPIDYIARAESEINDKNFADAYKSLEYAFLHENSATRNKAIQLYKSQPALRAAAIESFSVEKLTSAFRTYEINLAHAELKRRLTRFAQAASGDDLAIAHGNYEQAHLNFVKFNEQKAAAEVEKEKQALAAEARAIDNFREVREKSIFRCQDKLECDKAFALTQIYISKISDMKIQVANDTIIETYNPTDTYKIGVSAMKTPRGASSADISISVKCGKNTIVEADNYCRRSATTIYQGFPRFMAENLIK
ncbi:hypothetical protein [Hydrogenophaga defluvii]|uniref:Lipoprotein n=1 Tax=Hydrogenophaga defluvii TaxID=249410 RepID=A0ABW2SH96_9BURK